MMRLRGRYVSGPTIQNILARNGMATMYDRLLKLEEKAASEPIELTVEHIALIEKADPCYRERHVESSRPGDLLAQDTFFVGHLKGVGKVYLQAVVDTYASYAFGFLHTGKLPEWVGVGVQQFIDLVEPDDGFGSVVALVADHLPDEAVPLLQMGAIVLLVRPASSVVELMLGQVPPDMVGEELRAVVNVQAPARIRPLVDDQGESLVDSGLAPSHDRAAPAPAGHHVRNTEGTGVLATGGAAVVFHEAPSSSYRHSRTGPLLGRSIVDNRPSSGSSST